MTLDRRALLTASLALPFASAVVKEAWTRPAGLTPDASIALWPDGHIKPPAGLVEAAVQRSDDPSASDRMLQGITRPRLDIFRPEKPNGAAVILAPGKVPEPVADLPKAVDQVLAVPAGEVVEAADAGLFKLRL